MFGLFQQNVVNGSGVSGHSLGECLLKVASSFLHLMVGLWV